MKEFQVKYNSDFKVLGGNKKAQAAVMVLDTGESTGGDNNKHVGSDQWLYVISGKGEAIVDNKKIMLGKNLLLLIEAGETHEIKNTGDSSLETINFYVPPEY